MYYLVRSCDVVTGVDCGIHNEMNCAALSPDDNFRDTGMISCVIFSHNRLCHSVVRHG